MRDLNIVVKSIFSFVIRTLAALTIFLLSIFVGRELGIDEAGYYFLTYALVTVIASIAKVGLDETILKVGGVANGKKDFAQAKIILFKSMLVGIALSSFLAFVFYVFAEDIAIKWFNKGELTRLFEVSAFYIPLFIVCSYLSAFLQAMSKTIKSVIVLNISTNMLVLGALWLMNLVSAEEVVLCLVIAVLFSCLLGVAFVAKTVSVRGRATFPWGELFSSALPLWIASLMVVMMQWGGQLLLGIWGDSSDVALLAVAQRTSMLVILVLTSVNMVIAPIFASLYSDSNTAELKKVARTASMLMIAFAMPALLLMIVFPNEILSIFGDDFDQAAACLRVLAVGQFINVVTGSVGYLLSMSGHEKDLRNISIFSGVTFFTLCFLLIPQFGLYGAAYAISAGTALQNLLAVYFVKKRLGFNTLLFFKLNY